MGLSRLARRSGVAVVQIAEQLNWRPDVVLHVGVGLSHEEVAIMRDEVWNDPPVRFIGFEPNPRTFADITDKYPGELFPLALGNEVRYNVPFFEPKCHRDGSSLYVRKPDDKEYRVNVTTLDELYPDGLLVPHVMLWLDAEGSELQILQGGEKFLAGVDVINIEMTGAGASDRDGWTDQCLIHKWLMDHGYRRQWVHTQRIHVGQQDCIYVRESLLSRRICPCPCQLSHPEMPSHMEAIEVARDLFASCAEDAGYIKQCLEQWPWLKSKQCLEQWPWLK